MRCVNDSNERADVQPPIAVRSQAQGQRYTTDSGLTPFLSDQLTLWMFNAGAQADSAHWSAAKRQSWAPFKAESLCGGRSCQPSTTRRIQASPRRTHSNGCGYRYPPVRKIRCSNYGQTRISPAPNAIVAANTVPTTAKSFLPPNTPAAPALNARFDSVAIRIARQAMPSSIRCWL